MGQSVKQSTQSMLRQIFNKKSKVRPKTPTASKVIPQGSPQFEILQSGSHKVKFSNHYFFRLTKKFLLKFFFLHAITFIHFFMYCNVKKFGVIRTFFKKKIFFKNHQVNFLKNVRIALNFFFHIPIHKKLNKSYCM